MSGQGCHVPSEAQGGEAAQAELGRLGLTLRTDDACRLPVAAGFTALLQELARLPSMTAEVVELTLHEAVMNAVLHGNLGLPNEERGNVEHFGQFCETVERLLADPATGARAVIIAAWWSATGLQLTVADEGSGFVLAAPSDPGEVAHGRGLHLIRALTQGMSWDQDRRQLRLTFDISGRAESWP